MLQITKIKAVLLCIAVLLPSFAFSQITNTTRSYQERYAENLKGNFEMIGNVNINCTANCPANPDTNNPPLVMGYSDIDADATTINSSMANLTLPAGAKVTWAGLYWGGVNAASVTGINAANPALTMDVVSLKQPGVAAYTTINATVRDVENVVFPFWSTYRAFADITATVQNAGSGDYYVGNIMSVTGTGFTGPGNSWTMVVIYEVAGEKSRRINVVDGFRFFGFGQSDTFTVTGLFTPSSGVFETVIAYAAMDGEKRDSGDFVQVNGNSLANALNSSNNLLNGTISKFGVNQGNRNPNFPYNWSIDIDVFDASGNVANGVTSTQIDLGSTIEGIWSGILVVSNEIVLPSIEKMITPATIMLGDTATVQLVISNPATGVPLTGVSIKDQLPAGMILAATPNASSTCGATINASAGASNATFSAIPLTTGSSCTYAFDVTTNNVGTFTNSVPNNAIDFSNDQGLALLNTAQDDLIVNAVTLNPADFSCSSKVDVWYVNDESGSVTNAEFIDARDFIYLVTDGFYHNFTDGAQGGLIGWAFDMNPTNVVIPITENFYDQDDTGLASTGTSVDGDGQGVRENYIAKVSNSSGTHLQRATQGIANLISAGNGRRTGVPQVAVILTDAPSSQINNVSGNGGGIAWEAAAANLRNTGPDGVRIAVVLLAEAADAYNNNAASRATIDKVIGIDGIVIQTSTYAAAADPANAFIQQTIDKICAITAFVENDYGDAPISGTAPDGSSNNAYGEASHTIVSGVYLGAGAPDADNANQPSADAGLAGTDGDDGDGTDDEDGVATFPQLTDINSSYNVSVTVTNTSGAAANLVGWIDFDGNGTFDTDEAATVAVANGSNASSVTLSWNSIPADIQAASVYVRLRLTSDNNIATGTANTSVATGMATDGEVEDYSLTIEVGGFSVKGRVYEDSNVNAVNDTNEKGISKLPIVLVKIEANPANNTCISTRTNAEGNYTFFPVIPGDYQLYEASRETIPTPQNCDIAQAKDPAGLRSTTANVSSVFSVTNAEIIGKDFGDVQEPLFAPNNIGTILPNSVVFYAHTFTPKSTGTVNFTTANSTPTTVGWSNQLYQDSNCNGKLDNAEANTVIANNIATTVETNICLISKVYAPSNVSNGETFSNVISAEFDFNGNTQAGTKTLKVTDLSKAAANDGSLGSKTSRLELRKTVENLTQGIAETDMQNQAKSGDLLKYRVYYHNSGTGVITDLKINDSIPDFTQPVGAPICEMPLAASLTSCTPVLNGSDVIWTFAVNDVLEAGASGVVSFEARVE